MTGPGETRLKLNIKEASRMGEASFDDWDTMSADVPYGAVIAEEFGGDENEDFNEEGY